jgi:hypothetical protein
MGGTIIFGNKTLSQREGWFFRPYLQRGKLSSSFWGLRLWLVLPLVLWRSLFSLVLVIRLGWVLPCLLRMALFCLFWVIRWARGLITQNKCTSPYTKINKSRSALHVREGPSVRAVVYTLTWPSPKHGFWWPIPAFFQACSWGGTGSKAASAYSIGDPLVGTHCCFY